MVVYVFISFFPIPRSPLVIEDLHRYYQRTCDQGKGRKCQADTIYWRSEIGFQHGHVHIPYSNHSHYRGMHPFELQLVEKSESISVAF